MDKQGIIGIHLIENGVWQTLSTQVTTWLPLHGVNMSPSGTPLGYIHAT